MDQIATDTIIEKLSKACDIDAGSLLLCIRLVHCCDTCVWDFLLPGPPRHVNNTVRIFTKLLAWLEGLENKDQNLGGECVEYLESYLLRAYEAEFHWKPSGSVLYRPWLVMPGLFERLRESGIEVYDFFVFLHNRDFYMIHLWRHQVALLMDLLITFDKHGLDTTKLVTVFEILNRGTRC